MSAPNQPNRPPLRILLAKVGLDGHDRGIKVVARGLRDAGFHVIYGGIWQSPEAVARAAVEEDADWLGLSILSGAHLTLVPRVIDALRAMEADRVRIIVGGIIPDDDVTKLYELGVAHVFGPGTSIDEIVRVLTANSRTVDAPVADTTWPTPIRQDAAHRGLRPTERKALARSISLASNARAEPPNVVAATPNRDTLVVAVTGNAGVGKSSLVGKLIEHIRAAGRTVAVLACDPQSPVTGGALLGDRVRMTLNAADEGVYVRSLAAPSGRQSLAHNLDAIVTLTKAYGLDVVLLETAGAGQGDTAVRKLADVVVLLLQPESGDEMQWLKAGLLEVADIVVIHKADLPGAERVEAEVRDQLNLPGCREIPVVRVSAHKDDAVDRLWRAISTFSKPG